MRFLPEEIQFLLSSKGTNWLADNWLLTGNIILQNWEAFQPVSLVAMSEWDVLSLRRKTLSGITVAEVITYNYSDWNVNWNNKFFRSQQILLQTIKPSIINEKGIVTSFSFGEDYIGFSTENLNPIEAAKKADLRLKHHGFILQDSVSLEDIEKTHNQKLI